MFFFSSRRRHTRYWRDWSSDVCSSDLRLLRAVVGHLAVTGTLSVGDTVLQQIVGHGLAGRLSARLGGGVGNGLKIGRAAWRGRGSTSGVAGSLKRKTPPVVVHPSCYDV